MASTDRNTIVDDGPRHKRGQIKPSERPPTARDLRRLAEKDRRAKGRRRVAWALVAAVAVITASVVGSVWWLEREPEPAPVPEAQPLSGDGQSILVLLTDGDRVVGTALAAAHPDAADTMVFFPGSLVAIVPGYGSWDLSFASDLDEPDMPALTLTNLLGARIDGTIRVPVDVLASAMDGAELDFASPLLVEEGTDQVVVAASGLATRDAETIETVLSDPGIDDDLSWLVRQGTVWRGLLDRAAKDDRVLFEVIDASSGDVVVGRSVLEAIAADEAASVTAAQVEAVDSLGTGEERYRFQVDDAEAMVSERMPWLALVAGERIRVEVLNGTGQIGVTGPIAAALVRDGYRVVRTDNADDVGFPETRVVGHTVDNQAAALAVQSLLGFGEVRIEQRQPSLVVDVTVIVGDDFS